MIKMTALLLAGLFVQSSFAALIGRDLDGNLSTAEAYYDDVLDITWLADANYAQTSGYDADGLMDWDTATAWADSLTLGGYTGWRLAKTTDENNDGCTGGVLSYNGFDCGYNVDTSTGEMASMFFDTLGNQSAYDTLGNFHPAGWGLTNTGPFSNLLSSVYWSAPEYVLDTTNAWLFFFDDGLQRWADKGYSNYAWAVHDGEIGTAMVSPVPIPAAAWLFGTAWVSLLGLKKYIKYGNLT